MRDRAAAAQDSRPAADTCSVNEAVFALRALTLAGEHFRHAVADHFGVDLSATMAMSHLSVSGPMTPRQVAGKVGLTPSTVTALLDRLESAGYAARRAHPSDRRKTVVAITERGQQALQEVREWMGAAVGVFDKQQLPEVVAIVSTLAESLDAQTQLLRVRTEERARQH